MLHFFHRDEANPLLTSADLLPLYSGAEVACLLNPGVCRLGDQIALLVRVAERPLPRKEAVAALFYSNGQVVERWFDRSDPDLDCSDPRVIRYRGKEYLTTLSYLRLFVSDDGVHFSPGESYPPITGFEPMAAYGVEDARITQLGGRYVITCTAVSQQGVGVMRIDTADFRAFSKPLLIFPPHNKDVALFEEQIGGKYFALHRPSSPSIGGHFIWIAESPDTYHWGNHRCLLETRPGMWDGERVGAGASPIKTAAGWLVIYHGADANHRYALGAALLDKNNPAVVLARSIEPIMIPEAKYEQTGFFNDVVFTNGHYVADDGDALVVYYGAADSVICRATCSILALVDHLLQIKSST